MFRVLLIVGFVLFSLSLQGANKDSTITFKTKFYVASRPLNDALLIPNIQFGFRTHDFYNQPKNQFFQVGLSFANYAIYSPRKPQYYSFWQIPGRIQYNAEMDYRCLVRRNRFWGPHLEFTYFKAEEIKYALYYRLKGYSIDAGFQNDRYFSNSSKSIFNALYWGAGLKYSVYDRAPYSSYKKLNVILYLNWQIGFKSMK